MGIVFTLGPYISLVFSLVLFFTMFTRHFLNHFCSSDIWLHNRIFKIFLKIVKLESWTVIGIGVCGETLNVMSVSLLTSYLLLAKTFPVGEFSPCALHAMATAA